MEFKLYFCNDGILRAKFSKDKPMIPVKFLQENSAFKNQDFRFWVRWWDSIVYFEKGLTVSQFLFCLEPWVEFWSEFTGKELKEYIQEVKKPILVNPNEKGLDWIGILYYTELKSNIEYSKKDDEIFTKDLEKWFNTPKEARLTGEWDISSSYNVSGFILGNEEQYSINYTPINELANTPLILSHYQYLYVNDWYAKKILGENKGDIFKKDALGVCRIQDKTTFLMGEKYHKMKDVVEGFFYWMYSSPMQRSDVLEELKEKHEEYIREEKENSNNVVSVQNQEENIDVEKKEIHIVSGSFDSIINDFKEDEQYWENMLKMAKSNPNVILKIGKIQSNIEPEKRVFGHIVDEKDQSANPQKSEYKKI